jgi:hypothetical protein
MYGNFRYTLTDEQQSSIQIFLRGLPKEFQDNPTWELLHRSRRTHTLTPWMRLSKYSPVSLVGREWPVRLQRGPGWTRESWRV